MMKSQTLKEPLQANDSNNNKRKTTIISDLNTDEQDDYTSPNSYIISFYEFLYEYEKFSDNSFGITYIG